MMEAVGFRRHRPRTQQRQQQQRTAAETAALPEHQQPRDDDDDRRRRRRLAPPRQEEGNGGAALALDADDNDSVRDQDDNDDNDDEGRWVDLDRDDERRRQPQQQQQQQQSLFRRFWSDAANLASAAAEEEDPQQQRRQQEGNDDDDVAEEERDGDAIDDDGDDVADLDGRSPAATDDGDSDNGGRENRDNRNDGDGPGRGRRSGRNGNSNNSSNSTTRLYCFLSAFFAALAIITTTTTTTNTSITMATGAAVKAPGGSSSSTAGGGGGLLQQYDVVCDNNNGADGGGSGNNYCSHQQQSDGGNYNFDNDANAQSSASSAAHAAASALLDVYRSYYASWFDFSAVLDKVGLLAPSTSTSTPSSSSRETERGAATGAGKMATAQGGGANGGGGKNDNNNNKKRGNGNNHPHSNNKLPPWLSWIPFLPQPKVPEAKPITLFTDPIQVLFVRPFRPMLRELSDTVLSALDPTLLKPSPTTVTDLIDKILTSTPRLLAIANLLLALTYLLHAAVAEWFLGNRGNNNAATGGGTAFGGGFDNNNNNNAANVQEWAAAAGGSGGRERLGGFLVFKLLLISAVLAPDTLDLLILLSWYTLLSFLRSLAHLCAGMTQHTSQSGQAPRPGVLQLLTVVLLSDFLAAAFCVALFHGAGWGMVLLLTCDCALLAVDVACHILQHAGQVLDVHHAEQITAIENEQMQLHQRNVHDAEGTEDRDRAGEEEDAAAARLQLLEHRMEVLEQQQVRRLSILDGTVFGLQLLTHVLTVAHFLHIWSLHGVQFTLIDGVLALHLHSALMSATKKISERRNLYRIARDLDDMFENASELDLRKASAAGDVCCVCLGGMAPGNAKKVGCGHLYHTICLREVVERARSIEAARCPLCRASVLSGSRHHSRAGSLEHVPIGERLRQGTATGTVGANQGAGAHNDPAGVAAPIDPPRDNAAGVRERALFRFSSEEVFPAWLPLPAFSFEVVRRPSTVPDPHGEGPQAAVPQNAVNNNNNNNNSNNNNNNNNNNHPVGTRQPPPQLDQPGNNTPERQSFLRRLLVMAGAVPMSPEEEAAALEQLVEMFPQYARADLLRELRQRGSPEGVAEAVLAGTFAGVPTGAMFAEEAFEQR